MRHKIRKEPRRRWIALSALLLLFFYAAAPLSLSVICPGGLRLFSAMAQKKQGPVEGARQAQAQPREEKPEEAADGKTDTGAVGEDDIAALYNYDEPEVEEPSYIWLVFKALFVLAIFGGGFYLFFKFINQKMGMPGVGRDVVRILASTPLGQNKFVQIVDIAGRVLVLGITEGNVSLITEITEKDQVDRVRLLSSKSTPVQDVTFTQFLADQFGSVTAVFQKNKRRNQLKRPV
jgi:flagellar biogenesis protein FliO